MKTIIGLGNPGKEYVGTRHNVGFLVVDELARRHGGEFTSKRSLEAQIAEVTIDEQRVLLVKPQAFMNVSGRSLLAVLSKYPVKLEDVVVVYDDADLPFGEVRFKKGGGSAGHRGMESILAALPRGSSIARVRIGIGRPSHPDVELEDFVLGRWTRTEQSALPVIMDSAIQILLSLREGSPSSTDEAIPESKDCFVGARNDMDIV